MDTITIKQREWQWHMKIHSTTYFYNAILDVLVNYFA